MALVRELRRLQAWSPDNPGTRNALHSMVIDAFREALPELRALTTPVREALERSTATLETLIRNTADEAAERSRVTAASLQAAEKRTQEFLTLTSDTTKKLGEWLVKTRADLDRQLREPWYWRILPGLAAAAVAAPAMILALTLSRPGWTMTSAQRESLRIGESVSLIYLSASPEHQAEMRRVNRWRSPEATDTTTMTPAPRRP